MSRQRALWVLAIAAAGIAANVIGAAAWGVMHWSHLAAEVADTPALFVMYWLFGRAVHADSLHATTRPGTTRHSSTMIG